MSNATMNRPGPGGPAPCPCQFDAGPRAGVAMSTIARVATIEAASLAALTTRVAEPAARAAAGQPVTTQLHLTADGGRFASASHLAADGNAGMVHLQGNIGSISFDLDLSVSLDLAARSVSAKLHIAQPIPFDHQWTYQLEGGHATAAGLFATSLEPATTSALAAPIPHWWCVANCGGTAILGVLLECLPTLAAGGGGYIACVTAKSGAAAAGVASCIVAGCLA